MSQKEHLAVDALDIADIKQGYVFQRGFYRCLYCGFKVEEGVVTPVGDQWLTAEKAMQRHLDDEHGGVFECLMGLGKPEHGLSETQQTVIRQMYMGHSDQKIAAELGGKSPSTVRNHRFNLRRKMNEAKIFLAMMDLVEAEKDRDDQHHIRSKVAKPDDRYNVTSAEAAKLFDKHFAKGKKLKLISFPKKQKAKLVILNRITEVITPNKVYTEKEFNELLAPIYDDFVMVRRYLVDYQFVQRKPDGSGYWLSSTEGEGKQTQPDE